MSRKITIIGAGQVGSTVAYALTLKQLASEIVIIDIVKEKAMGEAMDIRQGTPFIGPVNVRDGDYEDAKGSDIVIFTSGVGRKPGQSRLDLTQTNVNIAKTVIPTITKACPDALYVIVANPVDILTYQFIKTSGIPASRIFGTGTMLDTARFRARIAETYKVCQENVHGYVFGEHGDSSFVPWDHAYVGCKKVQDILKDAKKDLTDLDKIYVEVRDAAYEIIEKKKATYYGIGLGLTKIVKTILNDTNEILTVSAYLNGEYGHKDIYIGVPAIINSNGARELLELELNENDQKRLDDSCEILSENMKNIREVL